VPEGDTIFRAARTLNRALAAKTVTRFESVLPHLTRVHEDRPLTGRTVDRVHSVGKHLLMHFSDDLILHTHMRMNGSWHIYRPGEAWRLPRRDMRLVIATADFEAVGFNVPVAEFIRESEMRRHPVLGVAPARGASPVDGGHHGDVLGPDLLDPAFDQDEALRRLRAQAHDEIADALLNQRVMAGIGNVYKSEVLFVSRVNPFARVEDLDAAALTRLVETARRLLTVNVTADVAPMTTYTGYRRTTGHDDPGGRLWVYSRAGQRCRRCGTTIKSRKQGNDARLTYWCSTCQPS
jgi:endonuclease-8